MGREPYYAEAIGIGFAFRFRKRERRSARGSNILKADQSSSPDPPGGPSFPAANVRSAGTRGAWRRSNAGEEFPDGHDWDGQVLQWRTWLWLHQARRRRARCVRSHHRGGTGRIEGPDRRTAYYLRSRTGQKGQGPQGGRSGDLILSVDRAGT